MKICATLPLACLLSACGADDDEEHIGKWTSAPNFDARPSGPDAAPPAPPVTDGEDNGPAIGLKDSMVVCPDCAPELLAAKRRGILAAMAWLTEFAASDVAPRWAPLTFHLEDDGICDETGWRLDHSSVRPADDKAHVCLYDLEKIERRSRRLPFDAAHVETPGDQLLPVHEAMHVWFWTRMPNYWIQEPLVTYASLLYAGEELYPGRTPGSWCHLFLPSYPCPSKLMYQLCQLGLDDARFLAIIRKTDAAARGKTNATLAVEELAAVFSAELRAETLPLFQEAALCRP